MQRSSFKQRHGYKGEATALNGLTGWIHDRIPYKGSCEERYIICCRAIVDFAKQNIEGFKDKGQLSDKASRAAQFIHRNNLFNQFTTWYNNR